MRNPLKLPVIALLATILLGLLTVPAEGAPPSEKSSSPKQMTDEVVRTLNSLATIPDVTWRFHEGNLAHGERVDLDEASWKEVKTGFSVGVEAAWFRTTVELPKEIHGYDVTGARIWLDARFRSTPVGEIVYINGRRAALGEDLEPIVLVESAQPGEKFVIAIKVLQTPERKSFNRGDLRVEPVSGRPSPSAVREEILATRTLLPVVPGYTPEMIDEVNAIATGIDLKALAAGDQAAFDSSLAGAHEQLLEFRPLLQQVTVDMTGNSHIDAAWRWTESETIDVVRRTYGTAVQLMSEYPGYIFTQSSAQYNEWLEQKYPAINGEIKRRVEEGRWEMVGGMWVEPDLNMPDGESLVRQLLLGKRYFKKEYGVDVRIGWNPDSFGYTWQLPQIYRKSGIDYFVTQKMHWNETNQLPLKLFWWESPDGSRVLTYFPTSYGHGDLRPSREAKDFLEVAERVPGSTEALDLYGVGDHGGGPTRVVIEEGERWSGPDVVAPRMRFSTAQEYFSSVKKTIHPESREWNYRSLAEGWQAPTPPGNGMTTIPTWKDELYLETHRGVYTTQAVHKRHMRDSEQAILNAEKYALLAWLTGEAYPSAEFGESWKKICFGQFHDLAAGAGIAQIYKDAEVDYRHVYRQVRDANEVSLRAILASADTQTGGGVPVAVLNPLAWNRTGSVLVDVQTPDATADGIHVTDAKGTPLLSQVLSSDARTHSFRLLVRVNEAPSLGYTVLHVLPGPGTAESDLRADGLTLENSFIKVTLDKATGNITSLVEKKSNFEMIAAGGVGNQLQAFRDVPKRFDAWNIDEGTLDAIIPIDAVSSIQLVEKGPLRAVIQIERKWQSSRFVQRVILEAGSDHVQFDNTADWQEEHVLLKAAFQLAATSPMATYEIPYGTIDRPTQRRNSFEKAMFEVPAIRWADLGDGAHGVTLMNRGKFGYDAAGNWLRLSLLRAAVFPDPKADRGPQEFSYAVYPHQGDWKKALSMRRGYEYNYPLQALQVNPHVGRSGSTHSFVSTDSDNIVITAMKKAEDRNALVLRLFEWAGKSGEVKLRLPEGARYAVLSDLMENPQTAHLEMEGESVLVPVKAFEIVTVQAFYDPSN
jgi:alpha-mannosidase